MPTQQRSRKYWLYTVFACSLLFIIITICGLQKEPLTQQIQYVEIMQNVGNFIRDRFQPNRYEVCTTPSFTNIAFVKVHKAGSTTVMNILERFAYQHNLSLVLPTGGHILHNLNDVMKTSRDNRYNMLINHVHHYDREAFQRVLYPDTKYIGIVREPLDLTVSAFEYYRSVWHNPVYTRIHGENPLQEYLKNREMYESGFNVYGSYTNNRMALDFGLSQSDLRNISVIQKFIQKIDAEFDLVMIMEYFVESVVFMRRLLCWSIKDVLFIKRNANSKKHHSEFTEADRVYHRNFSMADNLLYDHFLGKFKKKLSDQGDEFFEEVEFFHYILDKATNHCSIFNSSTLSFEESKFSPSFSVEAEDCNLILLPEMKFVTLSKKKQKVIDMI